MSDPTPAQESLAMLITIAIAAVLIALLAEWPVWLISP